MSKAFDKVTETLFALTEGDLKLITASRAFDGMTPASYVEKWIEHTQRDLVLEAFANGRSLVWAPKVEREGNEFRVLALTMPMGVGTY